MNERARVVVVGAGVAGLSTAWLVARQVRAAGQPLELIVLESLDHAGGATRSEQLDGYLCEWGVNGFLDNEPATLELVAELGMRERLVRASDASAHRFIFHTGRLHEVALSPVGFLASDIVPLTAKLRMALELFIPRRRDGADETVDEFGRRRLGEAFAQYLLDPMVSGIFAGNTRELSLRAVFPKMVEMEHEHGGLFRALVARTWRARRARKKIGGPSGPSGVLHTFRDGMGELTTRLASDLGSELRLGLAARSLERTASGFRVHTERGPLEADAVVLACPSHAAAPIIADLAPEVAKAVGAIGHAPVDVVCLGYRLEDLARPLDGFGVLVPRSEGLRALGALASDQIFPGQAPAGHRLLRTILGGAHDPAIAELDQPALEATAEHDLGVLFGPTAAPRFRRVIRHARGIAQYTVGHLERVAAADRLAGELPGLYFTGASYRGVSVNGCIKAAFGVAEQIRERVGDRPAPPAG
jgi:protoporphyrinogen/coproporphyrinogen III oxidase